MTKINQGTIEGNVYHKKVSFSEAILWKTREISLNPETIGKCEDSNVKWISFEDFGKNERMFISLVDFLANSKIKTMHQEKQYYIPIHFFIKEPIYKLPEEKKINEVKQEKLF